MRAVVYEKYGGPEVLRLGEVDRPVPKADEVLIRVHATTVTQTDLGVRSAKPFLMRAFAGLLRPRRQILGMELAGVVEEVGSSVTEFKVGDRVFGVRGSGAYAEFVCIRKSAALALMPVKASFEEAAAITDGASLALACLRRAELQPGSNILIYGATGAVGTAAVQLAKHFGAYVTAVGNTKNVELVRSLGADKVIDYTKEDFTKNGNAYDVVFDAVGKHSFRKSRRSIKPGGMFISTDPGFMWHLPLLALLTRWFGSKRAAMGMTKYSRSDVLFFKELVASGEFRPVLDRVYALEDVVEATRYVETGQKTGNVVLQVISARSAGPPLT